MGKQTQTCVFHRDKVCVCLPTSPSDPLDVRTGCPESAILGQRPLRALKADCRAAASAGPCAHCERTASLGADSGQTPGVTPRSSLPECHQGRRLMSLYIS